MPFQSGAHDAQFAEHFPEIGRLVADVMAEWHIAGLAVAVIQNSAPPLLQTFGLRDVESGLPVDRNTVFPIGSITKSFTVVGLALLVDDGKLDWDAPVQEILPEFRLKDPVASAICTLRDLLTHRTGLPRHDFVHMSGHLDGAGIVRVLRCLDPSKEFRSAYQYQNLMYWIAGLIAERITGQRWEDLTRSRILDPLGMTDTVTCLQSMVSECPNYAAPYIFHDGALSRLAVRPIHTKPSGSICATVADIAPYLAFLLDPVTGRNGLRLSPSSAAQMWEPQMYIGHSGSAEIGDVHYGLGLEIARYRGERLIAHGGAWSGYTCEFRMLPERGVAVAVLSNGHWHSGCRVVSNNVLDNLLGLDPVPWFDRLRAATDQVCAQRSKETAARSTAKRARTHPSHDLLDYAGDYQHAAYGVVRILLVDESLRWQGLDMDLPVTHRHYDLFELGADPSIWFENMTLQFHTDREGDIASLSLPLEPAVAPIVFVRQPDPATRARAFLEPLTGLYRRCGVSFRITLDATDQLTMARGNGPQERLLPRHKGSFALAGDPNFRLEFRRCSSGAVDAMIFHEATGVYLIERVAAHDQKCSSPALRQ
jgi:CubicO group peptidase (beta-lactamase class C family)